MLHVSVWVYSVQVTSFDKLVEHSTSALEQYGVWFSYPICVHSSSFFAARGSIDYQELYVIL